MGYETKALLVAIAIIVKESKTPEEIYKKLEMIANVDGKVI